MTVYLDLKSPHHLISATNLLHLESTSEVHFDRNLLNHEIIYIIEGQWHYQEEVDGVIEDYILKKDDILILPAGHHKYTKFPCLPNTSAYLLHISSSDKDNDLQNASVAIKKHFSASGNPKILKYLKSVVDNYWSNQVLGQVKSEAYLTLLFCEMATVTIDNNYSDDIKRVINYINANVQKDIDKNELLVLTNLTYKKLLDIFKQETGKTLHSYQLNKKLEMIASQIEIEPDIRMKELAAAYNFYDEFYLSKRFKQKYNMSPIQYKNKVKGKIS